MAKSKGLLASLEEDIKASGLTPEQLAAIDETDINHTSDEGEDHGEEDYQPNTDAARERIAKRREWRKSLQDEDGASSDDGRSSRGSDGAAPAAGDGAPQDEESLQEEDEEGLEEPKTPSAWAKHRREMRELRTKLKELETSKAAAPAEQKQEPEKKAGDPAMSTEVKETVKRRTVDELGEEPNKDDDLAAYLVWNAERNKIILEELQADARRSNEVALVSRAKEEIKEIESSFRRRQPDYDKAIAFATDEFAKAVRRVNPGVKITDAQVKAAVDQFRWRTAMQCARDGTDFAEVLYDIAIEEYGYSPESSAGDTEVEIPPAATARRAAPKPDLNKVASNRRRSATHLEGSGERGRPRVTLEQAARMSPQELMNLPDEDIAYLESMGL